MSIKETRTTYKVSNCDGCPFENGGNGLQSAHCNASGHSKPIPQWGRAEWCPLEDGRIVVRLAKGAA